MMLIINQSPCVELFLFYFKNSQVVSTFGRTVLFLLPGGMQWNFVMQFLTINGIRERTLYLEKRVIEEERQRTTGFLSTQ